MRLPIATKHHVGMEKLSDPQPDLFALPFAAGCRAEGLGANETIAQLCSANRVNASVDSDRVQKLRNVVQQAYEAE